MVRIPGQRTSGQTSALPLPGARLPSRRSAELRQLGVGKAEQLAALVESAYGSVLPAGASSAANLELLSRETQQIDELVDKCEPTSAPSPTRNRPRYSLAPHQGPVLTVISVGRLTVPVSVLDAGWPSRGCLHWLSAAHLYSRWMEHHEHLVSLEIRINLVTGADALHHVAAELIDSQDE